MCAIEDEEVGTGFGKGFGSFELLGFDAKGSADDEFAVLV